MAQPSSPYVSRGGLKLQAALEAFEIDPTGLICADLGASTGGFTDCLLKKGAAAVYAVDTAYGQLAWTLRQDERVVVLERSNALHLDPREAGKLPGFAGVDLVCIDLGWTRQARALPAAQRWLKPDPGEANKPRIISLIKPHYEVDRAVLESHGSKGILNEDEAESTLGRLLEKMPDLSMKVINWIRSPILGGGGGRKGKAKQGGGNVEYLALLEPEPKTK